MLFLLHGLQPFSLCESEVARAYVNSSPISVNTFMKYAERLTPVLIAPIARIRPENFVILFYRWNCAGIHYLAIMATCPSDNGNGYCDQVLFALSPFEEEQNIG